jgi:hypothetical protein
MRHNIAALPPLRRHGSRANVRAPHWEDTMMYLGNCEPPLDEVLDEPIVHLVMACDRLPPQEVRANVEAAQRWLRERSRATAAAGFI